MIINSIIIGIIDNNIAKIIEFLNHLFLEAFSIPCPIKISVTGKIADISIMKRNVIVTDPKKIKAEIFTYDW